MKPHRTCDQCGGPTKYAEQQDRFGCPTCLVWREPACQCDASDCAFKRAATEAPTAEDFA